MRQWVSGEEAREVSPCSGRDAGVGHSFDDLARSLAEGNLSRRRALRLFGAALVGMVRTSVPGMALAAPCPSERKCKKKCCPEPFICVGDTCVCPIGREHCPGEPFKAPTPAAQKGTPAALYRTQKVGGILLQYVAQLSVVCATVAKTMF
jgi:hypothetical protein